eukprot:TRINITY_DN17209_c0_g1_i1.p1 TRINITY_DN17209_c0_g1~~TRINITY_DN17209_c0_g1_i1.p1  ORF type:complete len:117 (+),score=11.03 TRINITY_DN17209_c0_g1_i1:259-609(+)
MHIASATESVLAFRCTNSTYCMSNKTCSASSKIKAQRSSLILVWLCFMLLPQLHEVVFLLACPLLQLSCARPGPLTTLSRRERLASTMLLPRPCLDPGREELAVEYFQQASTQGTP